MPKRKRITKKQLTLSELVSEQISKMATPVDVDKLIESLILPEEQKEAYRVNGVDSFLEPELTGEGDKELLLLQEVQSRLNRSLSLPEILTIAKAFKESSLIGVVNNEVIIYHK